jgi:hypothetical protein
MCDKSNRLLDNFKQLLSYIGTRVEYIEPEYQKFIVRRAFIYIFYDIPLISVPKDIEERINTLRLMTKESHYLSQAHELELYMQQYY